jgi:hypothetical protein
MVIVFSGMFARIFLSAALLLVILRFATVEPKGLIASFFLFYIVFTVLEIKYVHNKKQTAELT